MSIYTDAVAFVLPVVAAFAVAVVAASATRRQAAAVLATRPHSADLGRWTGTAYGMTTSPAGTSFDPQSRGSSG